MVKGPGTPGMSHYSGPSGSSGRGGGSSKKKKSDLPNTIKDRIGGHITRITTDPDSGQRTFYGPSGQWTEGLHRTQSEEEIAKRFSLTPEGKEEDTKLNFKQEVQRDLFRKQGYKTKLDDKGNLVATKGGKQIHIDKFGKKTVTSPRSATVRLESTPTRFQQAIRQEQQKGRHLNRVNGMSMEAAAESGFGRERVSKVKSGIVKSYNFLDDKTDFVGTFAKKAIPEKVPKTLDIWASHYKPDTSKRKGGILGLFGAITREGPSFSLHAASGYTTELRDKPRSTLLKTGLFFALPKGLKLLGKAAKPVAAAFPTASRITTELISVGIPAAYGTSVIYRTSTSKVPGKEFGKIAAGELTPMFAGGYAGVKFWPKAEGYIRTFGRKKIAVEELVPSKVLSGKERFPLADPNKQLELFYKSSYKLPGEKRPMMYHATGQKIMPVVGEGTSELPGLYGAHAVSPHFLRATAADSEFYTMNIFEPYAEPRVAAIFPKGFRYRGYKQIGLRQYEWLGKSKEGIADIPKMKTEVEAILSPGTQLRKTKGDYFFKYKGIRVPIDEFEVSGTAMFGRSGKGVKDILSSYSMPAPSSILSPGSVAIGLGYSSKSRKRSLKKSSKKSSSKKVSSLLTSSSYKTSSRSKPSSILSKMSSIRDSFTSRGSSFLSRISSGRSSGRSSRGSSSGSSFFGSSGGSSGGSSRSSSFFRTSTSKVPPPTIPGLTGKSKKKKKKKKFKEPFGRYTPSLRAVGENIIATGKPGKLTGLEVRPILKKSRKKKKSFF